MTARVRGAVRRGLVAAMAVFSASASFAAAPGQETFERATAAFLRGDYPAAEAGLAEACAQDHADACYEAGSLQQSGRLGHRDSRAGQVLFAHGCRLGQPLACVFSGLAPTDLAALPFDFQSNRVQISGEGCDDRDERFVTMCVAAGAFEAFGAPELRNPAAAARHLAKACDRGLGSGCYYLAQMRAAGVAEAGAAGPAPLWEQACAGGVARACTALLRTDAALSARR